ncbi:2-oxoglutarate dehydrogenase complex dihydrolipoyllysine-residue succinyltransferase [bacterium]|nr:2-oxoglutarate dehydrogenase complex dihydrolipoyllysine-residue succinyltransferase [bacterium]
MSKVEIKVPSVGESVTEGVLSRWLKKSGEAVKSGDPLFELETDKASNEVPALVAGVLTTSVAEGDTVQIGAVVGSIDTSAVAASASTPAAPAAQAAVSAPAASGNGPHLSPAVAWQAADKGVDPASVSGTGPAGRLTKGDILAAAEAKATQAAPAAPASAAKPAAPAMPALPAGERVVTRQKMPSIRQRIAQRLVEAQHTAAILTTFNEVDMSKVMDLRARYKDSFQKKHGIGLGFMSFFVRACTEALQAFPAVNAQIDGTDLVFHNYCDIGVAVSTERGLMVPVVRSAERMSFAQIEKAISDYAVKARENKISVNDLQGGTFTITNGGVFGSLLSTPILNPPQSAILGMHSIKKRPVVVDDQIVIRPMMYLALSYDHRIIDGKEAVSFLVRVKELIEDPERLLLAV